MMANFSVLTMAYRCLHLLLVCAITYTSAQSLGFLKPPEDTTSLTGTDVTMFCTVMNLQPSQSVLWYKGNIPLTNGSNVLSESPSDRSRFFVLANSARGEYNLVIRAVSLSDDARYECVVHQQGRPVLSSDPARLEVHKIPDQSFPRCIPLEKASYRVGEKIRLTCISERGNPPVSLSWNHGNRAIHTKVTQDDTVIGYRHLHYDLTVTQSDHGATYQCKMTTSAASSTFQRSCSLGPLQVDYKPQVSVQISPHNVVAEHMVSLFCDAPANPTANKFKWTFSRPIDESRKTYSRNNQQLDIRATLADNQTSVTCNATNGVGSTQGHVTLHVIDPTTLPPSKPTSNPEQNNASGRTPIPKGKSSDHSDGTVFDLKPEVLAVIAGTLALIVLVLVLLVLVTCRCTLQQNKTSSPPPPPHPVIYGAPELYYDQGSVYFEPKDRISIRDMPTLMRPSPWHRTVGTQVPYMEEEETYEEIGQDWDEGTVEMRI